MPRFRVPRTGKYYWFLGHGTGAMAFLNINR